MEVFNLNEKEIYFGELPVIARIYYDSINKYYNISLFVGNLHTIINRNFQSEEDALEYLAESMRERAEV